MRTTSEEADSCVRYIGLALGGLPKFQFSVEWRVLEAE